MSEFNLVQITDCHLGSRANESLLGMNTDQSLRDVLTEIQHADAPDMILVSGDISNDGGPVSYARFLSIVEEYFPGVPLAWLPGNHDEPENMLVAGSHPIELNHHTGDWHFILLDSRIPREEGGRIGPAELARLERELEAHPISPTAVFLHHQAVKVGSAWVDEYVLEDQSAFFDIIDRFPQVKFISWGHVHQEFFQLRKGVSLFATPSTCVQFLPKADHFQIDTRVPGYRRYALGPDGRFETEVSRVQGKSYAIDLSAEGY